mgnify:CR=1 FL=1
MWLVLFLIGSTWPREPNLILFNVCPSSTYALLTYNLVLSKPKLFSAFATADSSSFLITLEAYLGLYSKIANAVKSYNQIDMNKLFKQDILQVNIPVVGENDEYTVTIKLEGVTAEMQKNIKNNGNKMEFRTIVQALTKVFNTTDVYVKCSCPDFKYRFAHWNIIKNVLQN